MATDARIAVGLPQHPKTKKLIKRLGQGAAWNLVCLILWTASNRSDGSLAGMSAEDIELAADWQGEDGEFVKALADVRFIDEEAGEFVMHDWHEHNPWAAGADMRSAKARWNAAKRHHGAAEADRLVPEYAAARNATSSADSNARSNASSNSAAEAQHERSNAPSPSPSPSPSLSSVPKGTGGKPPSEQSKTELWHSAVSLLSGQGMPDVQARSFVGKLAKDYPDGDIVLEAVRATVMEQPADARAYLKATCQRLNGDRKRGGSEDWTRNAT
jgi:hypothetical protein